MTCFGTIGGQNDLGSKFLKYIRNPQEVWVDGAENSSATIRPGGTALGTRSLYSSGGLLFLSGARDPQPSSEHPHRQHLIQTFLLENDTKTTEDK